MYIHIMSIWPWGKGHYRILFKLTESFHKTNDFCDGKAKCKIAVSSSPGYKYSSKRIHKGASCNSRGKKLRKSGE